MIQVGGPMSLLDVTDHTLMSVDLYLWPHTTRAYTPNLLNLLFYFNALCTFRYICSGYLVIYAHKLIIMDILYPTIHVFASSQIPNLAASSVTLSHVLDMWATIADKLRAYETCSRHALQCCSWLACI